MRMRIDAARHDELPTGLDHPSAAWRLEVLAYHLDRAVGAVHIGPYALVRGNDGTAANEYGHGADLLCLAAGQDSRKHGSQRAAQTSAQMSTSDAYASGRRSRKNCHKLRTSRTMFMSISAL